jgi:hypothetical protein
VWILRSVKTGAEGEDPGTDLMEISRPEGLGDIADLGLTLAEAKLFLAPFAAQAATEPRRVGPPQSACTCQFGVPSRRSH